MRVEIFFVPGCPNYEAAVERVKKVLTAAALNVEVRGIPVNTAEEARDTMFPGSPTIRVNGDDVEPDQMNAPGLTCRLYANGTGVPSEGALRMALARAKALEKVEE